MPQVVDENVEKVLGKDWMTKYHNSLSGKERTPVLKFDNVLEEKEFLAYMKQTLNPENPRFEYKKGGYTYDAFVITTLQEIQSRPLKFGVTVPVKYQGDWISMLLKEDEAENILSNILFPNNTYVVVGKYSEKKGSQGDKVFKNLRLDYIKSFAELAEQKEEHEVVTPEQNGEANTGQQ